MTVKCPKCGEVTDYSYLNKCKCGCEFTVLASEEGIEVKERTSKGFTIKCNECGLQVIYNQDGNLLAKDNDDITMYSWGYTHETRAGIYCECGNKIGYIEEDEAEDYIHPYAAKSNAERGR